MKKQTGFEIAINFLLYSYFGITIDSSIDEIINASIKKAYSDATNQAAFNALRKTVNGKEFDDETKSSTYKKAQECLKEMADELKKNQYGKDAFKSNHKDVCNKLVKFFEDITVDKDNEITNAFSYGNAQKWVNMTMKYLYVICNILEEANELNSEKRKFVKNVLNTSEYFHIPIDSYILEYLWTNRGEDFVRNLPDVKPLKRKNKGTYGTYSAEKVKSWSTWNGDEYDKFTESLANSFTIEDEGPAWIEIAKVRKK